MSKLRLNNNPSGQPQDHPVRWSPSLCTFSFSTSPWAKLSAQKCFGCVGSRSDHVFLSDARTRTEEEGWNNRARKATEPRSRMLFVLSIWKFTLWNKLVVFDEELQTKDGKWCSFHIVRVIYVISLILYFSVLFCPFFFHHSFKYLMHMSYEQD